MEENLEGQGIEGEIHEISGDYETFIEFSLGPEDYAIPLLNVREVISQPDTTPIPRAPGHFCGIMNLRGQVISVVDLRKKLKVDNEGASHDEEAVIIVELFGMNIGIVVDSINKVFAFDINEVNLVPEISSQVNSEYIDGVYRNSKEGTLTVLLDIAKVLEIEEVTDNEEEDAA